MKFLKTIIKFNRNLSDALEKKIPAIRCPDRTRTRFKKTVDDELQSAEKENRKLKVLEVGSIDRPFIRKTSLLDYHGMDIEYIVNPDGIYDKYFVQSIEDPLEGKYDLIISRMVMEHVPDNQKSWKSIYDGLDTNGKTIHIFPGSSHPFSLATRLVGNRVQKKIIPYLRPNAENTGYPAYYHLCTPRKLKKELSKLGFQEISIYYSYGALDYFKFFFPAFLLVVLFNLVMTKLKIGEFASNIYVLAKK